MIRLATATFGAWCLLVASPAAADPSPKPKPKPSVSSTASVSSDSLLAEVTEMAEAKDRSGSGAAAHGSHSGPVFSAGSTACIGAEAVVDIASVALAGFGFCPDPDAPRPILTVGLIRNAFAELKLPAGTLVIQPPDGLTLVNFDTNFYTTSTQPITRTVTLLGRRVTLQATPSTYHWTFGDGETLTTSDPGAPYPNLRVTHNYLHKDTYRPHLATTYTGRYRIARGPWHQIPGTVTIHGTSQPLRAIEAEPKLVSY